MITKRILTSSVLIGLAFLTLLHPFAWSLYVTIVIILGMRELYGMVESKGVEIYKYFGMLIGFIIPLSIYFQFELGKGWEFIFIIGVLLSLFLLQFARTEGQAILGISSTLFGIFYVSWCGSFLVRIRLLGDGTSLVLFLIATTKMGDVGAYLFGTRFGKTPLIPRISPKKSVEGAIGGFILTILTAAACRGLIGDVTYTQLIIIGLFIGILAQVGDLSESLLKRDCNIKDSGNLLPGMGGILDMADSLIFTAPAFYLYLVHIGRI